LALQAPNAPYLLVPEWKRHTFWTACPSCKVKGKHPIEHLNSEIVCQLCKHPFTAIEVQRPRKIKATKNVAPHPSKKPKNVENVTSNVAPPPKKVKKAEKKTEEESFGKKFSKQYIQVLLKDMTKAILEDKKSKK
ncbi:hypothetical protein EJB05_34768, partial [Eragrostis curvula]